jgi:hypothetical protein
MVDPIHRALVLGSLAVVGEAAHWALLKCPVGEASS